MAQVITMPRLSPTMEEGVLAKWAKKEGDKIAPGDVIAEVETDKANMDFPLEEEGVLLRLLVKEGETVKLGAPVAVVGQPGEDVEAALAELKSTPAAEAAPTPSPTPSPSPIPITTTTPPTTTAQVAAEAAPEGRIKVSPLARKLADEKGVDLRAVHGSGPGGRIVKRDVEAAPAGAPAAPVVVVRQMVAPVFEDQLLPASQMRKTIARRLVEAKRDIPHIYLTADATVDRLLQLRAELNELGPHKVSVNDLVVKALALALRRVPEANASWTAEGILRYGRVDIGVAVSLPDGLITPVVRGADWKPLGAIAEETKALAERARERRLRPEEYTGGTATVSNLGMYGVREFVAILNPPESVIVAVGASEKRPMVIAHEGRDEIAVATRMTLTVSCDHRVVDGVLGARLLAEVVRLLEKPLALVLG
jgi:pyruvate dehydrogenase E2 component (dihydrolipoamide acetyltransferase)